MCYLLQETSKQVNKAKESGVDSFTAKNDSQVYMARNLSQALAEYYALNSFKQRFLKPDVTDELKPVMNNIFQIFGLWSLDKHLSTFYLGSFASGSQFADFIRSNLLKACSTMKDSAVAVADSLSPPDWVLNSVIGKSDGKVNLIYLFF